MVAEPPASGGLSFWAASREYPVRFDLTGRLPSFNSNGGKGQVIYNSCRGLETADFRGDPNGMINNQQHFQPVCRLTGAEKQWEVRLVLFSLESVGKSRLLEVGEYD
jgi:hypothetical protein